MALSHFLLLGEEKRFARQIRFVFRHHEFEDLDKLSPAVFDERKDPKEWKNTLLHRAICLNKQLGAEVNPEFLESIRNCRPIMTLEGRMRTFPNTWLDPPKGEMANAGFYYESEDTVCCFMCCLKYSWERDQTPQCPWKIHQELAPNCKQLKRTMSDGPLPTHPAKRRRRSSMSTAYDLLTTSNIEHQ